MPLGPLAGVIVAVTNRINPTDAFTKFYIGVVEESQSIPGTFEIGGLAGMLLVVFPGRQPDFENDREDGDQSAVLCKQSRRDDQ